MMIIMVLVAIMVIVAIVTTTVTVIVVSTVLRRSIPVLIIIEGTIALTILISLTSENTTYYEHKVSNNTQGSSNSNKHNVLVLIL